MVLWRRILRNLQMKSMVPIRHCFSSKKSSFFFFLLIYFTIRIKMKTCTKFRFCQCVALPGKAFSRSFAACSLTSILHSLFFLFLALDLILVLDHVLWHTNLVDYSLFTLSFNKQVGLCKILNNSTSATANMTIT